MPLFFLFFGVLLVVVGVNNRIPDLVALVKEDATPSDGSASFAVWILAIVAIGLLGTIKQIKPISNAFLILVIVVMLLSNKGFFTKFEQTIRQS